MTIFEASIGAIVLILVLCVIGGVGWLIYSEVRNLASEIELEKQRGRSQQALIESLKLKIDSSEARISSLKSVIDAQQARMQALEASSKLKDGEIERLRNRLMRRDEDVAALSMQLVDLRSKYDALIESNRRDRSGF